MDNIISIILKDQNKLKKDIENIIDTEEKTEIIEKEIIKKINELEKKIKKIKNKIKKLKIIITFLFITNLTTIFLLWR